MENAKCGDYYLTELSISDAFSILSDWNKLFGDLEPIAEEHLEMKSATRFFEGHNLIRDLINQLSPTNSSPGKKVHAVYVQNQEREQSLESISLVNWEDKNGIPKLEFILTHPKNFFRGYEELPSLPKNFFNSPRKDAATSLIRLDLDPKKGTN